MTWACFVSFSMSLFSLFPVSLSSTSIASFFRSIMLIPFVFPSITFINLFFLSSETLSDVPELLTEIASSTAFTEIVSSKASISSASSILPLTYPSSTIVLPVCDGCSIISMSSVILSSSISFDSSMISSISSGSVSVSWPLRLPKLIFSLGTILETFVEERSALPSTTRSWEFLDFAAITSCNLVITSFDTRSLNTSVVSNFSMSPSWLISSSKSCIIPSKSCSISSALFSPTLFFAFLIFPDSNNMFNALILCCSSSMLFCSNSSAILCIGYLLTSVDSLTLDSILISWFWLWFVSGLSFFLVAPRRLLLVLIASDLYLIGRCFPCSLK